jgi:hypothetical protein
MLEIDFVAVTPSDIIRFTSAPGTVRADGLTVSELSVRIASGLPPDKRMITFKTTAGTFVGSGGVEEVVNSVGSNTASVLLLSPTTAGTAQVTATVNNVTATAVVEFVAADPNTIVRFVGTTSSAPADGATLSPFTVRISPELSGDARMVTFKATAGTWAVSAGTEEVVQANAANQAGAQLRSPSTITTSRVSATANGVVRETSIRFFRAEPDKAIEVRAEPLELVMDPAEAVPQSTVIVTLVRNVGTPTEGTRVFFDAVGSSNQKVGFFSNVTVSDNQGQATATYVPGTTTYRGEVRIFVTAEGTDLRGRTTLLLSDPPPED